MDYTGLEPIPGECPECTAQPLYLDVRTLETVCFDCGWREDDG